MSAVCRKVRHLEKSGAYFKMAKVVRTKGPGAKELEIMLTGLDGKQGRAGWFETAKYPDGTPVAYVASIMEFGYAAKNIPPRLGLRELVKKQTPRWREIAKNGIHAVIKGNASIGQVMEGLGMSAAGDIRKRITSVNSPPLKPSTVIARAEKHSNFKGLKSWSIKPLVDTGLMLATANNDVIDVKKS